MVTMESLKAGRQELVAEQAELRDLVTSLARDMAQAKERLAICQWKLSHAETRTAQLADAVGRECLLCGEPIQTMWDAVLWSDRGSCLSDLVPYHRDCVEDERSWRDSIG